MNRESRHAEDGQRRGVDAGPTAPFRISPQKAISPKRDRTQSRLLTVTLGTALGLAMLCTIAPGRGAPLVSSSFRVTAFAISAMFAFAVLLVRAATPGGAVAGGTICALLAVWTGASLPAGVSPARILLQVIHSALTPLALLFICTFLATHIGRSRKAARGLAESRRGRSSSQVLANLAAAGFCASVCGMISNLQFAPQSHGPEALALAGPVLSLAALAEATADTVSSEVGQGFGGQPRMLLNLRPTQAGTDGAITIPGSVAGITAGLLVALSGQWAMGLSFSATMAALTGGIFGLFFDSLLGGTVERRGWLGNDLVNFSSTVFAAFVALLLNRLTGS